MPRKRFLKAGERPSAIWWIGRPLVLVEAQNGQETALAALATLALVAAARRGDAVFAAACVTAVLARSDLWLLAAGVAFGRGRPRARGSVVARGLALAVYAAAQRFTCIGCAMIFGFMCLNPDTIMPPYGRHRILTEEEIDRVVDYVQGL